MSKWEKFRDKLLSEQSDKNIEFDELCNYLKRLGFNETIPKSSHHRFDRDDVPEILNLQPLPDGKAKRYQVEQVRDVIRNRNL